MVETRLGRVVHEARGYTVFEVLQSGPDGNAVVGYSLVGPHASSSIIYSKRMEAVEALHDIDDRTSGSQAS